MSGLGPLHPVLNVRFPWYYMYLMLEVKNAVLLQQVCDDWREMPQTHSGPFSPCLHVLIQFNLGASIPLKPIHIILVNMLTMVSTLSTRPPLWQNTLVTECSEKRL